MTDEQYAQAVSFWTRKDAAAKKMDQKTLYAWIDTFLAAHKILALAVGGSDFIRCTPLEYAWHEDALWIFTEGGLKFKGLRDNKNIAAAIFDVGTTFTGNLRSLQLEGTAEVVAPDSVEYSSAAAFRKIPLSAIKKLPEPLWLLKITPTEITCLNSDFKNDGFGVRQIWQRG